jgi:hypothetical protein
MNATVGAQIKKNRPVPGRSFGIGIQLAHGESRQRGFDRF